MLSHEDGDSMFLQYVAVYLQAHMAWNPGDQHQHLHCCESLKPAKTANLQGKIQIWDLQT